MRFFFSDTFCRGHSDTKSPNSFSKRCCISVPFLEPDSSEHTVELVRARSGLLYWAIIAVGAREAEELASTHDYARRRAVHLSRLTFGRKPPTLDDFQGYALLLEFQMCADSIYFLQILYSTGLVRSAKSTAGDEILADANMS